MLKLVLILIALETYNLLTVSYSVLWIVVFVVFLALTYYWRSKTGKSKRSNRHIESAPLV